jgi:hypothetical protein
MVTQARRGAAAGNLGTFRSVNDEADIQGRGCGGDHSSAFDARELIRTSA